jgi:hypothetical protein
VEVCALTFTPMARILAVALGNGLPVPCGMRACMASITIAQLAAHMHAGSALHGCHTRHTLHGTGQVGGTVGTESPAQFEQTLALGTGTLELLATGRTDLEI